MKVPNRYFNTVLPMKEVQKTDRHTNILKSLMAIHWLPIINQNSIYTGNQHYLGLVNQYFFVQEYKLKQFCLIMSCMLRLRPSNVHIQELRKGNQHNIQQSQGQRRNLFNSIYFIFWLVICYFMFILYSCSGLYSVRVSYRDDYWKQMG